MEKTMEKDEQKLRDYLLRRVRDYCCVRLCKDCDVQETCSSVGLINVTSPVNKMLELYFAMYPDMKPNPEMMDQVFDYLKKEIKRQLVKEANYEYMDTRSSNCKGR